MRSEELKKEEDDAHAAIKGYKTLREHAVELRKALVTAKATFGHSHWDSTMRSGAGCTLCIAQNEAVDVAVTILEETQYLCEE